MPWKKVIIIPWFQNIHYLFRLFSQNFFLSIIKEQIHNFFFSKSNHFIKIRSQGNIISYIKPACYIIHSNRRYSCDKELCNRSSRACSSRFYNIKKVPVKTFPMCNCSITLFSCTRKDCICKIIIFIYEYIKFSPFMKQF